MKEPETRAEKLARKARERDTFHRQVNGAIEEARQLGGVVTRNTQDRLNAIGYGLPKGATPVGVKRTVREVEK